MADKKAPIIIRRKKIVGGHGHHGGAWKVAYADFVTAMMAFFLVMWLMGSDEETKAAVSHYFNHPNTPYKEGMDPDSKAVHPMGERKGEGDSVLAGMGGMIPDDLVQHPVPFESPLERNKELAAAIREIFGETVFEMEIELEYVRFYVPESLIFAPSSSQIKKKASKYLDRIGALLRSRNWNLTVSVSTTDTDLDGRRLGSLYESSLMKSVSILKYFVSRKWMPEENIDVVGMRNTPSGGDESQDHPSHHRVEFVLKKYQDM